MLDRMTHAQFDEWCAKDLIEPIGTSGTNEILTRLAMMIAGYLGQEDVKPSAFAWWMKSKKDKPVDDDVAIAALEAIGARKT
jgi:hypothetical protein